MRKFRESPESCRRQEIHRLRTLAAEAVRHGDKDAASKLDRLADALAQKPLPLRAVKRPRKHEGQEKLW